MTKEQAKLILDFARCDMNRSKVGKEMYLNSTTVRYRLQNIKKEYGLNPERLYDLCRLVVIAVGVMEANGE